MISQQHLAEPNILTFISPATVALLPTVMPNLASFEGDNLKSEIFGCVRSSERVWQPEVSRRDFVGGDLMGDTSWMGFMVPPPLKSLLPSKDLGWMFSLAGLKLSIEWNCSFDCSRFLLKLTFIICWER